MATFIVERTDFATSYIQYETSLVKPLFMFLSRFAAGEFPRLSSGLLRDLAVMCQVHSAALVHGEPFGHALDSPFCIPQALQ